MSVFKADGTGKWALYSGTDDDPFDDPRGEIARIHATSEFDYLSFPSAEPDVETTVEIVATVSDLGRSIEIGAHGRDGVPFVFGQVLLDGLWVPLLGSVPVHASTASLNGHWLGDVIYWTLAVSDTHIYLREGRTSGASWSGLPVSRDVRFWISHNIMG